jgi:hypothetical protein
MAGNNRRKKATNGVVTTRRDAIRRYMARGMTRPTILLKQEALSEYYTQYKNPLETIRQDIRAVRKENERVVTAGLMNQAVGEYQTRTEELLIQCWKDFPKLVGSAKVGMARMIHDLSKDLARLYGIETDRLDPKTLVDGRLEINGTVKHEHEHTIPDKTRKEVADILARDLINPERTD